MLSQLHNGNSSDKPEQQVYAMENVHIPTGQGQFPKKGGRTTLFLQPGMLVYELSPWHIPVVQVCQYYFRYEVDSRPQLCLLLE